VTFNGTATQVGVSPSGRVTVFYDATLGASGLKNAQDLVADADRVMQANDALFGITSGNVQVLVWAMSGRTDGAGGAVHASCNFTTGQNIEVDASFGSSNRCSALFEAELSECCMGGTLCLSNTGEALSRWCASNTSNDALTDYESATAWVGAGKPDWVTKTDPHDTDMVTTGCGMVFISWLISLGNSLNSIAPAMVSLGSSGTFAQLYAKLTGDSASNALTKFMAAVNALANPITTDDPFKGVSPAPSPSPTPAPSPTPSPSPVTPGTGPATGAMQFAAWQPPPGYPLLYPPAGLLPPPPAAEPTAPGAVGLSELQKLAAAALGTAGRSKSLGMVAISGLVIMGIIGITALSDGQDGGSK
jgi:hypothetical protein